MSSVVSRALLRFDLDDVATAITNNEIIKATKNTCTVTDPEVDGKQSITVVQSGNDIILHTPEIRDVRMIRFTINDGSSYVLAMPYDKHNPRTLIESSTGTKFSESDKIIDAALRWIEAKVNKGKGDGEEKLKLVYGKNVVTKVCPCYAIADLGAEHIRHGVIRAFSANKPEELASRFGLPQILNRAERSIALLNDLYTRSVGAEVIEIEGSLSRAKLHEKLGIKDDDNDDKQKGAAGFVAKFHLMPGMRAPLIK